MGHNQPPLFYVVDWLPPDFGAVGQYGLIFARELAERGRRVYLIGLTTGTSAVERQLYPGGGVLEIIRISSLAYNKARNIERLLWTFRTNLRLVRALMAQSASHKADVLFTGAPPFMLFFAIPLKVLRKVRLIYRITDFYPEVIIAELGKRSFLLRALEHVTWLRQRQERFVAKAVAAQPDCRPKRAFALRSLADQFQELQSMHLICDEHHCSHRCLNSAP